MLWYVEPTSRGSKALILIRNGVRYVCPLVNSLAWSVQALKDLSEKG